MAGFEADSSLIPWYFRNSRTEMLFLILLKVLIMISLYSGQLII